MMSARAAFVAGRRRVLLALATVACIVIAGSGVGGRPAAAGDAPVLPPDSMAATGDSFSRGFATGSGTCNAFVACPEYSWSTGDAVSSHYERLLALNPDLEGNATNAAVPGLLMSAFATQAATIAPSQPEYVTVLFGGGDICFGATTPTDFATQFRAGLDVLFSASPATKVLVASIWSFESIREAVLAGNPAATWSFCGTYFNASPGDRALMMSRVEAYNDALATECATYPGCRFDDDALFDHVWAPDEVSPVDNLHPSVAGQEMIAALLFDAGYRWGTPISPDAAPAAPIALEPRFTG